MSATIHHKDHCYELHLGENIRLHFATLRDLVAYAAGTRLQLVHAINH